MKNIIISNPNQRLDKFLSEKLPNLTRTYIQKLIKNGDILVNNKKVNAHYKTKIDDKVQINIPKPKKTQAKPEKIPLDIIHEDKNILVINKPAGLVVHPAPSGHKTGTLVNAILHHCKDLSGISGELRPGIVHRLDKNTSGLLIIAKNDKAHQDLSNQIKNRKVKKIYWALIKGKISPKEGSIEAPIGRSAKNRKKMDIKWSKKGKYALTHYKVLKEFADCSLLEIQIITGRTHQIRVHLSAINHPIIGDTEYGNPKINKIFAEKGLKRQFLHAKELSFKKPGTGKKVTFSSELPKELKNLLTTTH